MARTLVSAAPRLVSALRTMSRLESDLTQARHSRKCFWTTGSSPISRSFSSAFSGRPRPWQQSWSALVGLNAAGASFGESCGPGIDGLSAETSLGAADNSVCTTLTRRAAEALG